jgi:hypothetical protein
MTDFATYYYSNFREDINKFFSTIPDESKFHEDREQKQILSIQYERLTPTKNHLNFLDKETREFFGIALFFNVLTDMVCYTYYKEHYADFQKLTHYPKLIGNCLSWCHYHLHPKEIFNAMNQGQSGKEPHLLFIKKFSQAIGPMEEETIDFFNQYLTAVSGTDFWKKCVAEFPY